MKYIIILLLLNGFTLMAQKSGKVIYKSTMVQNPIDTTNTRPNDPKNYMFREMEKVNGQLENVAYTLDFNQDQSVFSANEFMENDAQSDLKLAIMASSADGVFYNNSNAKEFFWQIESEGKKHRIVADDKNENWKISKETKVIGEYKCYKATIQHKLNNKILITVEAWFTPEIPFSFGPKGYGGLPGLILALNERGFYFYAERIQLSHKDKKIEKPNNGKKLTPDEYDSIISKRF